MSRNKEVKCSSYTYFEQALRALRLEEFPCGAGSWRDPKLAPTDAMFTVTTKELGVHKEKIEDLLEYLHSVNWSSDVSWSNEAEKLKEKAIINPWKLETNSLGFFHKLFYLCFHEQSELSRFFTHR